MAKEPQNIVHEADAQRQHMRIHLPAKMAIEGQVFFVIDWSNGGVALAIEGEKSLVKGMKDGSSHQATILFDFSGFALSAPVELEIRYIDLKKNRIGMRFTNLNRQQISIIQYMVSSYIAGEVVAVNDLLDVVGRNNFTRARSIPKAEDGMTPSQIMRRKLSRNLRFVAISAIFLGLLCFVGMSMYEKIYIIKDTNAMISANLVAVEAPAGGKVYFENFAIDSKVKQGDMLLSVATPTGNVLNMESPCDCIVKYFSADNNSFVRKGETVIQLIAPDAKPFVEAYMENSDAIRLKEGQVAMLGLSGHNKYIRGKIKTIQTGKGMGGKSRVIIEPSEELPISFVDDPVEVRVDVLGIL